MLEQSWESYATVLANTPSADMGKAYEELVNETLVSELRQIHDRPAKVVIGRDTRESGPALIKALKAALDAVGAEYRDYGHLTTPQLHYMTRCINTAGTQYAFGEPTEQGYYQKMAGAFKQIMHGRSIQGSVTVDCANGVGGPKLREFLKYIPTASEGGIDIKVVNDDTLDPKKLNSEVGLLYRAHLPAADSFTVRRRLCQDQATSSTELEGCTKRSMLLARRRC